MAASRSGCRSISLWRERPSRVFSVASLYWKSTWPYWFSSSPSCCRCCRCVLLSLSSLHIFLPIGTAVCRRSIKRRFASWKAVRCNGTATRQLWERSWSSLVFTVPSCWPAGQQRIWVRSLIPGLQFIFSNPIFVIITRHIISGEQCSHSILSEE